MRKFKSTIIVFALSLALAVGAVGCDANVGMVQNETEQEAENQDTNTEEVEQSETEGSSSGINESAMEKYGSLKEFSTKTLSGDDFTQENLKDTDITMVNFWGTFCAPCIEEMKEIAELNDELPENVKIISICVDGAEDEEAAKDIVKNENVNFPVLLNNDNLNEAILNNVMYVPFTIFVDSEGNIVGNTVDGAPMNPKEGYKDAINGALNAIGKADLNGKKSEVKINEVDDMSEDYANGDFDISEDMMYGMPENFDDYFYGYEVPGVLHSEVSASYKALAKAFNNEEIDYNEFAEKLDEEVNSKLRDAGVLLPYSSIDGLLEEIDGLKAEDYKYISEKLDMIIGYEGGEVLELSEDEYTRIEDKLREIFAKYDLNYDEVISQIMGNNIQFAVYSINGEKVKYNDTLKANDFTVSDVDRQKHLKAIEQMREIIPAKIWEQIGQIEFNTDGQDMVAAYCMPKDNDFQTQKFRLAIDMMDVMDEKGNLTKDGISTIVHETGHIITLNTEQATEISWTGMGDESIEERYKEGSYLLTFYNKFWKPTEDEFAGVTDQNDMEAVMAAYEYYDSHMEDFVSDYAATNVEEDIAESFMNFVLNDKATGNTLADQKVNFFYDYPELVELRNQYRTALNK